MAFEGLSEKLQNAFKKLTGKGKLNEQNIKDAMREVRMALLEADVNYLVVKDFIKKVTERCVGAEILANLNAGQQVIKIVNEELTALMGGSNAQLTWSPAVPTIYMLCGLQGASSSCRWWANRWACPCLKKARRTPCRPRRKPSTTPGITGGTC